jgi:hypothetical protein
MTMRNEKLIILGLAPGGYTASVYVEQGRLVRVLPDWSPNPTPISVLVAAHIAPPPRIGGLRGLPVRDACERASLGSAAMWSLGHEYQLPTAGSVSHGADSRGISPRLLTG